MTLLTYVVEIIVYAFRKNKTYINEAGEEVKYEKPVLDLSIVAVIVSILFAVYFFVPIVL